MNISEFKTLISIKCMPKDVEQLHRVSGRGGKRGRGLNVGDKQTAGLAHPYHPVKDEVNF